MADAPENPENRTEWAEIPSELTVTAAAEMCDALRSAVRQGCVRLETANETARVPALQLLAATLLAARSAGVSAAVGPNARAVLARHGLEDLA